MTKRQLIDEILERNTTADVGFLARFDDTELDEYLSHLRRLQTPRLTGDASRYEKYFQFNVPATARPVEPKATRDVSPCLPEEEADVDDSFWHLDQEFESDDEEVRRRVDRFAEQLLDRITGEGDLPDDDDVDDDGGGAIVYHHTNPSLDDDGDDLDDSYEDVDQDDSYDDADAEEEETLQETAARSASPSRDHDSWLF